jgi:hypothetical protein
MALQEIDEKLHRDENVIIELTLRASRRLNVFLQPWHTFACVR